LYVHIVSEWETRLLRSGSV